MASTNPFDLLVDEDNDDMTQLLAKLPAAKKAPVASGAPAKPTVAKLPTKPLPPTQAVREAKTDGQRGGGRSGPRGAGRGGRGGRFNRDSFDNENSNGNNNGFSGGYRQPLENGDSENPAERYGSRGGYRAPRRGGYGYGEGPEREPKRVFERRSGTGRENGYKREGAGRGNWGTAGDEVAPETEEAVTETEKIADSEKQDAVETNKENTGEVAEEKEPEEKPEMTLEEYEKVLEEKRKALVSQKTEERKVALDKDLAKMQVLSSKKGEEEIFAKLGSEKDKRKEAADKDEKVKKSVSIEEFLKPAEGERYNNQNGRGRGRGRGFRGGYTGGNRMNNFNVATPSIEDVGQFPSLGVK